MTPWEKTDKYPRSLSWAELDGNNLVRFVYLDESGISAKEQITVVAGVIIKPDQQWTDVANYVKALIKEYVPAKRQDGFAFHATDLFHGGGKIFDRRHYPLERSHEALKAFLQIPGKFSLPLVYGFSEKAAVADFFKRNKPRRTAAIHHAYTFTLCALAAEQYMRGLAEPSEIATLVAENNEDAQKSIKIMETLLRKENRTEADEAIISGLIRISPGLLPIKKIVDCVHFASKDGAILLQIADACAFIIRCFLEKKQRAKEFCDVLTGNNSQALMPAEGDTAGSKILHFAAQSDSLA